MFLHLVSFLLLFSTVFAINFPGRLSAKEAAELRKTCGRRPVGSEVYDGEKKSMASKLTTRVDAPWVTSVGVLISKRHILTCAHCVEGLKQSSHNQGTAKIVMTCNGSNRFMNCTEKPMLEVKIDQISYPAKHRTIISGRMKLKSDVAILTLKEDIESSDLVYPACIAGYPIAKDEPVINFGYGKSSDYELAQGRDQIAFLQTFTAKRITEYTPYWTQRDLPGFRGIDPVGSHGLPGDSGSGFIHTRNRTASVYGVLSAITTTEDFILRVSAHLYWINYITGIDVKDEDMEFVGYFYPLEFKDNRNKKTYKAGSSHPMRVLDYINSQ